MSALQGVLSMEEPMKHGGCGSRAAEYPQGVRRIRKKAKLPMGARCAPLQTVYRSISINGERRAGVVAPYALGSATHPAMAEAAATAGEARIISEVVWPMRPTKFRLVVETVRSPSAITPMCPPRHGPHVGVETAAPASINACMYPRSIDFK